MCLTIPKKVISVGKGSVKVCSDKSRKAEKVGTILKIKKGDWVLTQNNVIINKITPTQAREIHDLFKKK
jgi:hydrogenase maturation factor